VPERTWSAEGTALSGEMIVSLRVWASAIGKVRAATAAKIRKLDRFIQETSFWSHPKIRAERVKLNGARILSRWRVCSL
jgi:hypothetical protein